VHQEQQQHPALPRSAVVPTQAVVRLGRAAVARVAWGARRLVPGVPLTQAPLCSRTHTTG
jgi:hypothetical protein